MNILRDHCNNLLSKIMKRKGKNYRCLHQLSLRRTGGRHSTAKHTKYNYEAAINKNVLQGVWTKSHRTKGHWDM